MIKVILGILLITLITSITMFSGCIEPEDQNETEENITKPITKISGDFIINIGIGEQFKLRTLSNKSGNVSYSIFWGDGTCCRVSSVNQNAETVVRHTWQDFGTYFIKVNTVFGVDGTTIQTVKQISVENN